jgi:hypothetical protein
MHLEDPKQMLNWGSGRYRGDCDPKWVNRYINSSYEAKFVGKKQIHKME